MPHLIIGHTTDTTARIWLQGDLLNSSCTVTLTGIESRQTYLRRAAGYTGVVEFDGLDSAVDYEVHATFRPSRVAVHGRLRTHRATNEGTDAFSFVLSSCNLSIVSITDLLALMVAMAGTQAARTSLDLPLARWPWRWRISTLLGWLKPPLKWLSKFLVWLAMLALQITTRLKQPAVEYIRSPFLKLSAVFESTVLQVNLGPETTCPDHGFLQVGDEVRAAPDAASAAREFGPGGTVTSLSEIRVVNPSKKTSDRVRSLVVTHTMPGIAAGLTLFRRVAGDRRRAWQALGKIEAVATGSPWFQPPSFFLHAGDQIYYDFPKPDRKPDRHEYRRAYREAWAEDKPLEYLLAHWPHYMTLDDHEIADQFALDFNPPSVRLPEQCPAQPSVDCEPDKKLAKTYLVEATTAYREYVHALAPQAFQQRPPDGPFWYTFAKKSAGFFVLDTRTNRRVNACRGNEAGEKRNGEMIDGEQLNTLLKWLELPYKPKFIVTSVPFVAELTEPEPNEEHKKREWFREAGNDKWCAPSFKKQRDAIIETIAWKGIEDVVFLTGDMHCCYHATMRIAVAAGLRQKPKKYESITVHELAGGPVNQLQLAKIDEFHRRRAGRTGEPNARSGFAYEVRLEQFHADVAAVMHIAVDYQRRRDMPAGAQPEPELVWNVIRTLTDPGPNAWPTEHTKGAADRTPNPEPVMGGRITFTPRRTVEELQTW